MRNMHIEKPDREIPANIKSEDRSIEVEGLVALYVGKFKKAEEFFTKQVALRRDKQTSEHRAVDKGGPLHNLGLSFIAQQKTEDGLRNILLAYIEDTLNANFDEEDDADRTPAAIFLRDTIRIKLRILRELKAASRNAKAKGLWSQIFDPADVLSEVGATLRLDISNLIQSCEVKRVVPGKMPLGFPQPPERRVFIGTNYDSHAHVIPPIKEAVVRKGYTPVIVNEVNFDPNETHNVSLLLLHTCKRGIFDITALGGQLMEIERARDYGLTVQLVRSAPAGHPPYISQMVGSLGYDLQLYTDPATDFEKIVRSFLP